MGALGDPRAQRHAARLLRHRGPIPVLPRIRGTGHPTAHFIYALCRGRPGDAGEGAAGRAAARLGCGGVSVAGGRPGAVGPPAPRARGGDRRRHRAVVVSAGPGAGGRRVLSAPDSGRERLPVLLLGRGRAEPTSRPVLLPADRLRRDAAVEPLLPRGRGPRLPLHADGQPAALSGVLAGGRIPLLHPRLGKAQQLHSARLSCVGAAGRALVAGCDGPAARGAAVRQARMSAGRGLAGRARRSGGRGPACARGRGSRPRRHGRADAASARPRQPAADLGYRTDHVSGRGGVARVAGRGDRLVRLVGGARRLAARVRRARGFEHGPLIFHERDVSSAVGR